MSFESTLCILLAIIAILMPIITLIAVKIGFKLAAKPEEAMKEPIFNVPKPKQKPKVDKQTRIMFEELENINAYNGTGLGQRDIKYE